MLNNRKLNSLNSVPMNRHIMLNYITYVNGKLSILSYFNFQNKLADLNKIVVNNFKLNPYKIYSNFENINN